MTRPRVTTSPSDALGATLADSKGRLSNLEALAHRHDQPSSSLGPVGTIVDYIGTSAPAGWAILDGSTITGGQTLYPDLWTILPASFKSGANIVLPDTRGRVAVGRNPSDTDFDNVGDSGGAKTVTLTTAQMPSHTHTQDPHYHAEILGEGVLSLGDTVAASTFVRSIFNRVGYDSNAFKWRTSSDTATNQNTGGGGAHNNLQPYIVFAKIMKLV